MVIGCMRFGMAVGRGGSVDQACAGRHGRRPTALAAGAAWRWLTVVCAASLACDVMAKTFTYDFESLTAGVAATNPTLAAADGVRLIGQDGWEQSGDEWNVETNKPSHLTSYVKVARSYGMTSGKTQIGNARFGTTQFAFDLAGVTNPIVEYIGTPGRLSGEGLYVGLMGTNAVNVRYYATRIGPVFGWSSSKFYVRGANYGTGVSANKLASDAANDWYRFRLEMDLAANDGNGFGTMKVKNLSDNESTWRTVLTGVNLEIKRMHDSYESPSKWVGVYLRAGGYSTRGGGNDDWGGIQQVVVSYPDPPGGTMMMIR